MMSTDFDAIRARLEAATPGEWRYDEGLEIGPVGADDLIDWQREIAAVVSNEADALFIVKAPGDIRALLDEVAQLSAALDLAQRAATQALGMVDYWREQAEKVQA